MIVGFWGFSLNALAIAVLAFGITLTLLSIAISKTTALTNRLNARSRTALLWSGVLLPWFISLMSVIILALPTPTFLAEDGLRSIMHWHHINTFNISSWHGASLIIFCLGSLLLFLSGAVKAHKNHKSLNHLNDFIEPNSLPIDAQTILENDFLTIQSDAPQAFTSGLLQPKCYITRGLRDCLSTQELKVVYHHEKMHADNFDPLKKYLFSLFASFFPSATAAYLNEAFSLSAEQLADQGVLTKNKSVNLSSNLAATSDENSKLIDNEHFIAKTIIKLARLCSSRHTTNHAPSLSCYFSATPFELRIRYLLEPNKGTRFPITQFIAFTLCTILISTLSIDFFHHAFEKLFQH